ncbi:MAG: MGMT family protein [Clostridia bacterium]|nr:MGMT family protein [Clostridia bacterium]
MPKKKTWQEKLDADKDLPKIEVINEKMSKKWGSGTLVIPAPREVDKIMKEIPKGNLITSDLIRQKLARTHNTTIACPLTTGIFIWIAAHAADEAAMEGKTNITPYWRTLKSGGELNEKYPGGIDNQKTLLELEGHKLVNKGKKHYVESFEKFLVEV